MKRLNPTARKHLIRVVQQWAARQTVVKVPIDVETHHGPITAFRRLWNSAAKRFAS